jgi:hypothetical protein
MLMRLLVAPLRRRRLVKENMANHHFNAADTSSYNFNHNYGDYHLTQATLALAYEQKTANLIALYSMRTPDGSPVCQSNETLESIGNEIVNRLGLD